MDRSKFINYCRAVDGTRPNQPYEDLAIETRPATEHLIFDRRAHTQMRLDGGEDFIMDNPIHYDETTEEEKLSRVREELRMVEIGWRSPKFQRELINQHYKAEHGEEYYDIP